MEGHCTTGRNRQCGIPVETHMHAAGTVGGNVSITIFPCRQSRVVRHSTCAHGIVDGDEGTSPSTEGDHVVAVILPMESGASPATLSPIACRRVRCSSSRSLSTIGHAGRSSTWIPVGVMEFVSGEHVGGAMVASMNAFAPVGVAVLVGERHVVAFGIPIRHEYAGLATVGDVLRNVFDRQASACQRVGERDLSRYAYWNSLTWPVLR